MTHDELVGALVIFAFLTILALTTAMRRAERARRRRLPTQQRLDALEEEVDRLTKRVAALERRR